MLTAIAAGLSFSDKAIALPLADQTDGQLISQAQINPTNRLDQVRAEVVSVSNDGDVRVRLANGSYRTLPNVNPQVLNSLRPGDEVLVTTTAGNDIVNVAIAPDTVQQARVDEETDEITQAETVDETEVETVRESSETETIVERETVRQETTPLPVSEPERITPVPVTSTSITPPPAPRALW
jgi:translation initiation factor IF-1